MIASFADPALEKIAKGERVVQFVFIEASVRRKIRMIEIAGDLQDLRVPPGNRLEKLKGDRKGMYSIRVNDQWRICFRWTEQGAADVELIDYHK